MLEILNGLGWLTALIVYCYMGDQVRKQINIIADQQRSIDGLVRGVDQWGRVKAADAS